MKRRNTKGAILALGWLLISPALASRDSIAINNQQSTDRQIAETPINTTGDNVNNINNNINNNNDSPASWWSIFTDNVAQTWRVPQTYDFYLPVITWHARFAYDREHINRYNERPWGLGGGVSRLDGKGNWHGLYLMAFKESFNKWEPVLGYGWEARWPLWRSGVTTGLGYTAGFTARDNWRYIPVPLVLPLASINYGMASFQMTYIPGTYNNGNVYFAWLRWQF